MRYNHLNLQIPLLLFSLCFTPFVFSAQSSIVQPPPSPIRILLDSAQTAIDLYRPKEALAIVQQAETLVGTDRSDAVDFYCLMTHCLLKNGRRGNAAVYMQKAQAEKEPVSLQTQAHRQYMEAYVLHDSGRADKALPKYEAAYELYKQLPEPWPTNAARAALNPAVFLVMSTDQFDQALELCNLAQTSVEKSLGTEHPLTAHVYHTKGLVLERLHQYPESGKYYARALDIRTKRLSPEHKETINTLLSYSVVLNALGRYETAKQYLFLALSPALDSGYTEQVSKIYANLGVLYLKQWDSDQAIDFFNRGLKLEQQEDKTDEVVTTYFNIAMAYVGHSKKEALEYAKKGMAMATPWHPERAGLLNKLGFIYQLNGDYEQGKIKLEEALTYNKGGNRSIIVTNVYNQGRLKAAQGKWKDALNLNQEAQRLMGYTGKDFFEEVADILPLYETMVQECRYLWEISKEEKQSSASLQAVRTACRKTIHAFDWYTATLHEPVSRRIMKESLYPTLEIALSANQLLYEQTKDPQYWRESFHLAEQSKAVGLYEAIAEKQKIHTTLSGEERRRVLDMRADISAAKASLKDKGNHGISEKEWAFQQRKIVQQEIAYQNLWSNLKTKYSSLRQIVPPDSLGIESVQKMLRPGQSLIEYMTADYRLFIFLVQKNHFEVLEFPKDSLEEHISTLTEIRHGKEIFKDESEENKELYSKVAYSLYQQLLSPVREKIGDALIVVPDGSMYNLPFEILLTKPVGSPAPAYAFYPFVIHRHCISYTYSATLLNTLLEAKAWQPNAEGLLGMSPFFADTSKVFTNSLFTSENRSGTAEGALKGLRFSGIELDSIRRYWPSGHFLKGNEANLNKFMQLAPSSKIIHLSTHGEADPSDVNTFIAFAGNKKNTFEKFYTEEMSEMFLSAELIMLSACRTGLGKHQISEGVFSMARASAQAGAKSIITTLWNVNDYYSMRIGAGFYRHLKEGKTKDEALRQAKLDFMRLNLGSGEEAASPWAWSAFIPIGDMSAIK